MPTLTELKTTLELALKDPDLNAETYVRPLRQAGLLTTGGRGPSTPQVNPRDCARLLIAIMAPAPARHAVRTVEEYEVLELRRRPAGARGRRLARAQLLRDEELAALPLERIDEVQLLGQLVEFLLLRAADGSLGRLRSHWRPEQDEPLLSLRLVGPAKAAILRLRDARDVCAEQPTPKARQVVEEGDRDATLLAYGPSSGSPSTPAPGLTRAAEVHEDAFIALGRLFSAK